MRIVGSSANVVLEWTTNYGSNTFFNEYWLKTTGQAGHDLWAGRVSWDLGRNLAIDLTPTQYTLTIPGAQTLSGSMTGSHGLSAADFVGGGRLRVDVLARKSSGIFLTGSV
jgi:hypothetical protein